MAKEENDDKREFQFSNTAKFNIEIPDIKICLPDFPGKELGEEAFELGKKVGNAHQVEHCLILGLCQIIADLRAELDQFKMDMGQ